MGSGEHAPRVLGRALDADGSPIGFEDDDDADQVVAFGGEFEVGRPRGLKPGTPLDFPVAVNSTPLPLEPGRYEWRLTIDGDSHQDSDRAVHRAWRGAVAGLSSPSDRTRTLGAWPETSPEARRGRSPRARHRPPARRSVARSGRCVRLEPRDHGGTHPCCLRQGVLRCVHRGVAGVACVDHGYRMPDRRFSERIRLSAPRKRLFRGSTRSRG